MTSCEAPRPISHPEWQRALVSGEGTGDRRQAPLGPDTALFGNRILPGTSAQSPNTLISPSTFFDVFDCAQRLLEARRGRPNASPIDLRTPPAFGGQ
ncbi:hypothetical protein IEO21_10960 [Rhodonia placenta]|uniref:Uncharacterized protein n=1 Tax=Rhodonia placenta TaxID=104341 RepID=A0A8H7NRH2_9APHY|nr:hypothetical protein IEO21_10960 [Postia placenta]